MKIITNKNKLEKRVEESTVTQVRIDEIKDILSYVVDEYNGLGLSSNQIGMEERCCIINVKEPLLLINPRIVDTSGKTLVYTEQCLSIPKTMRKPVKTLRFSSITVETDNVGTVVFEPDVSNNNWRDSNHFFSDEGLLETVVAQHQIDLLNGVLITDSSRRYSTTFVKSKSYGRNEKVMVRLPDGSTDFMKFKHAKKLLKKGAEIL